MNFIWIEDRDLETGHGWRDALHRVVVDPADTKDGRLFIFITDEEGTESRLWNYPECSYAWICPEEYYEKNGHLEDNIRTGHVKKHYPNFTGVDDMESHFEFHMSPAEMRTHLTHLGMREVTRTGGIHGS